MKIYLDPGHGKSSKGYHGANGNGIQEDIMNLEIAKKLNILLKGNGHITHMSREDEKNISIADRCLEANKLEYDIFLSIHCNSAENALAQGFESIYHPGSSKGKKLSDCIFNEVVKTTCKDHRSSRVDTRNLGVLVKTRMPAVVIECGFISNIFEANLIKQGCYQWLICEGIANGIEEFIRNSEN